MPSLRDQRGQASVELVALLPLLAFVALLLWQAVLLASAAWTSAGAARAAARAQAIGADALRAGRLAVPSELRGGVSVRVVDDGVRVGIAVPVVLTGLHLATIDSRARLPPQR